MKYSVVIEHENGSKKIPLNVAKYLLRGSWIQFPEDGMLRGHNRKKLQPKNCNECLQLQL
jgi:hypothetical protein